MCGRLKFSWQSSKPVMVPSDTFPTDVEVIVGGSPIMNAFWNGFAREETLKNWTSVNNWVEGTVRIEGFTEQGREFPAPKGKVLKIIALLGKSKPPVNIVTRAAETPEEKAIHPRFPVFVEE